MEGRKNRRGSGNSKELVCGDGDKLKDCIDVVPEIPIHIIADIVSRLPIKAILRCRCVCKIWRDMISEPHFPKLHVSISLVYCLQRSPRRPPVNVQGPFYMLQLEDLKDCNSDFTIRPNPDYSISEPIIKLIPGYNIPGDASWLVNSCNGMLCFDGTMPFMYICNPVLGEYITIPKPDMSNHVLTSFALGFSPRTDQYKVIRTFKQYLAADNCWEAEIYTLGSGSWTHIGNAPFGLGRLQTNAFLNGTLHWVGYEWKNEIRGFDFGSKQFRIIPAPPNFVITENWLLPCVKVGVLGGFLIMCDAKACSGALEIWMMKDYGVHESWSKMFVIDNIVCDKQVGFRRWRWRNIYEPLCILKSGNILLLHKESNLLSYNPKSREMKHLSSSIYEPGIRAVGIKPTFVSLKDVAEEETFRGRGVILLGSFGFVLLRAGRIEDAVEVVKSIPMEPSGSVWGSLLKCCKLHGNASLAEFVAERFFEVEPNNPGNHVMLSNIYANAGMPRTEFTDLWQVEALNSETQRSKKVWNELMDAIEDAGYVPKPEVVLHNAEEEVKVMWVCGHSE
ncbi:E motif [Dillenia turbinata]|uniref:E motif n=1 Tax=Dillenia turbinata TaxID=194707 RepID=A0AAN8UTA9_9MAGN